MALATAVPAVDSASLRVAYASFLRTLERSPRTITKYDRILGQFAQHLEHGDLLAVSEVELKRLLATSPWFQGLSNSHKQAVLTAIIGFYNWLVEDAELLAVAPTAVLRRFQKRLPTTGRRLPTYLTMREIDLLLEAMNWERVERPEATLLRPRLRAARDRAITGIMAYAGGRLTETVGGLQLGDVDLRHNEITFHLQTKGDKDRTVPISPLLRPLLEAWLRCREDVPGVETFFMSGWGGPIRKPHQWAEVLHRTAMRAQLQWVECGVHGKNGCQPRRHGSTDGCRDAGWRVHPHALRHSFAIEALRSSACTLAELRDLLGHESIATTNIYLQIVRDASGTERFRRRFGKGSGK